MFKGVKNFLSAAFLRWAKPADQASEPILEPSLSHLPEEPSLYDPVNEIFIEQIFPWPCVQTRADMLDICEDVERYLEDSLMSVEVAEHKGPIDLHMIMTKEGIKFRAYHAETAHRRDIIPPIDIEAFDPNDDEKLMSSMSYVFDALKARGFIFEEEEAARIGFGMMTEMINIEANRPDTMPRSAIIHAEAPSRNFK